MQADWANNAATANLVGRGLGVAGMGVMYGMGGNSLADVQKNALPYTDGSTGVTGGKYAGMNLYAGDLY